MKRSTPSCRRNATRGLQNSSLQAARKRSRPNLFEREGDSKRNRYCSCPAEESEPDTTIRKLQESVSLMEREIQYLKERVSEIENKAPRGSAFSEDEASEQEVKSSEGAASTSGNVSCPIPKCGKTFKRSDALHRHVKSKMEREHIRLAEVWKEKHCRECNQHFSRDCDFIRHQNSRHPTLSDTDVDSRIEERSGTYYLSFLPIV
jgi:hypothetical protein